QFVRNAKVIAIATVKSVTVTTPRCQIHRRVVVEPKSFLRGTVKERTLEYTLVDHTWNPKEKCPSVSYAFPPRAQVSKGIDIIVVVQPWGTPPKDEITATFNMDKLEDVRRWAAEKPEPKGPKPPPPSD